MALSIVVAVTHLGHSRPAAAEGGAEPQPLPRTAIGAAFAVALAPGEPSLVGPGVSLEAALGRGRVQYFAESSFHWMAIGEPDATASGHALRGGAGVRWLARAAEPDHSAAIELTLEATLGAHHQRWDTGATSTRPELGIGVGWQLRGFVKPAFAIRMGFRATFAPAHDDPRTACTGCAARGPAPPASGGVPGLLLSIGVMR